MAPRWCSTARPWRRRRRAASRCKRERGLTLVHPYDDARIIAGQGTIALEMLEEVADLDVLVIPIGGGGLIAGNAIAARAINPEIEIVGAEAALYPSMWNALHNESAAARRADAGRRHRGQECRQADAAGGPRAGRRDHSGRRGAARARGQRLPHLAEDHGGRRRRRRPCRHAGAARALPRQKGRPHSVRRQYRSAHSRLHHGARARAREPHRLVPPHHSGPARRARARSRPGSARSAPIFSRSITAGCSSTCRPRAPSSTSRSRRATPRMPRRSWPRSPPTAISRCASRPARAHGVSVNVHPSSASRARCAPASPASRCA